MPLVTLASIFELTKSVLAVWW